jgi:hypothetical protein
MPLKLKTSAVEVDVKLKPVGNEILVPKPEIKMRRADTGEALEKVRVVADKRFLWVGHGKQLASENRLIEPETEKQVSSGEPETEKQVSSGEALEVLEHYNYKLLDSKANVVDEKEMGEFIEHYYVDEKGEEHVVRPFDRTTVIEIPDDNWVPSTMVDDFVITAAYELFTDKKADIIKLWEEAEKRLKTDTVGVTTYSHGRGFVQYYAFLVPIVQEGKFAWLLKLTDTKVRLDHMMEIPAKVKIPIKEAPTLETLPPVQLIMATSRRKKPQQQTS